MKRIQAVNNLTTGFVDGAGIFHLGRSELRDSRRCSSELSFVLWAEYVIVVPRVMVAITLTRRCLQRKVNLFLGFHSSEVWRSVSWVFGSRRLEMSGSYYPTDAESERTLQQVGANISKLLSDPFFLNTACVYLGSPTETWCSFRFSSNLFMNETHPHPPPSTTWVQAIQVAAGISVCKRRPSRVAVCFRAT